MRLSAQPMLLATLALAAGVAFAGVRERNPTYAAYGSAAPIALLPSLTGQPEYCLTCHDGIEEISAAHPTEVFGCVRCHGGQPLALDAETAHAGMLGGRNPSAFDVVEVACGGADCHTGPSDEGLDHIHRSLVSLQSTYAGAIAVVRYAFGAQPNLAARFAVNAVRDPEITTPTGLPSLDALLPVGVAEPPQVQVLAGRCLTCHLGAEPLDQPGRQRMTGCAACHAVTNWDGAYTGGDPTISRDESGHALTHRLTTAIPYTQCDTCHNRGNYRWVDMDFHERTDLPADGSASRLQASYQPIAQFTACEYQLDCIDCHPSGEVMGDGDLHSRMDEVRAVECRTCHGTLTEGPQTRSILDADDPALRQAHLNPSSSLQVGDTVVVTERGETLWNVRRAEDGTFELTAKVARAVYAVPQVAGSSCEQVVEEQTSSACHVCHAVERH
jgi:Cytochrome c554 and c-prime